MMISAMKSMGTTDANTVAQVLKRYNAHFFSLPRLQIKGRAAQRIRLLMSEETLPPKNGKRIISDIETHTWADGPWSDSKLDIEGFYVGRQCRDVTHEDWGAMFTGTELSQSMAISWNQRVYGGSVLQRPAG